MKKNTCEHCWVITPRDNDEEKGIRITVAYINLESCKNCGLSKSDFFAQEEQNKDLLITQQTGKTKEQREEEINKRMAELYDLADKYNVEIDTLY